MGVRQDQLDSLNYLSCFMWIEREQINLLFLINQKMSKKVESSQLAEYQLIKYEEKEILVLNRQTRKVYEYYETSEGHQEENPEQEFNHPVLIKGKKIENAILYPQHYTNLQSLLTAKRSSQYRQFFTSQQLGNTFLPIFQCLAAMHSENKIHGNLSPRAILVNQEGEIKLRDWKLKRSNNSPYYSTQDGKLCIKDDLKAIGTILLQSACLEPLQTLQKLDIEDSLKKIVLSLDQSIVLFLMITLKGKECHFQLLADLLQRGKVKDVHLLNEYLTLKTRALPMQPVPPISLFTAHKEIVKAMQRVTEQGPKSERSLTSKFVITSPKKKPFKLQNYENNRFTHQIKRKEQRELITKMKQRINAVPIQMMTKNVYDNRVPVITFGFKTPVLGTENSQMRKDSTEYFKYTSPMLNTSRVTLKKN